MKSSNSLQFIIIWDLSNYRQRRTTGNKEVFGQPILSQVACHETASTTYGKISMSPMLATITMMTIHQSEMITIIYLMIFLVMLDVKMTRMMEWKKMLNGLQMMSLTGLQKHLLKQKMWWEMMNISNDAEVQTQFDKVEHFLDHMNAVSKVLLINWVIFSLLITWWNSSKVALQKHTLWRINRSKRVSSFALSLAWYLGLFIDLFPVGDWKTTKFMMWWTTRQIHCWEWTQERIQRTPTLS